MAAFSTSGADAIQRVIDVQPDTSTLVLLPHQLEAFYEIDRTAEEIAKGNYKRIALQFPDELLHDSVPVFRRLRCKIGQGRELYVLADTSYGSCCVDEVAASHVDADVMVHYGHACMSQTSRLPVIYVFGRKPLSLDNCISQFISAMNLHQSKGDKPTHAIILKHEVAYRYQADLLAEQLKKKMESQNISVIYQPIPLKTQPSSTDATSQPSTALNSVSSDQSTIFYVGGESLGLTNLLMTNSFCTVYSFNPESNTARLESSRTNRLLMRRYAVVQKARDADVFGILVGTLGVASYLPLIKHIRSMLAKKQKKSYTISVGKLNPAKLANFLEIECFVLIACPENSMIDTKDFLRPIVTPYELEVALQAEQSWTGRYILDFEQLLADAPEQSSVPGCDLHRFNDESLKTRQGTDDDDDDSDQPVFSLVSGTYRQAKRFGSGKGRPYRGEPQEDSSTLVLRNQDNTVAQVAADSAAGQFLQQRTYKGLEIRLGEDTPSILEQGRSGIARGYQGDLEHQV